MAGILSGGGYGILKGRGKQNKLVAGSRLGTPLMKAFNGDRTGLQQGRPAKKTLKGSRGHVNRHYKRG